MKLKPASSIALSMVTMLLLSMMAIFPAFAAAEIYVDPANNFFDTATTNPGDTFTVTVKIINYANVFGWQVQLYYDNTLLNATSIDVPPTSDPEYIFYGLDTAGSVTFFGANYAKLAESQKGAVPGVTGAGPSVLGRVTFEILKAPGKLGELSSALAIDNVDTFLLDPNLGTIPGTIKTNGLYKYTWSPPVTNPHLEVSPTTTEFGRFEPAVNKTFNIDVLIMNLETGWAITNASFVLKYNTTVIDVIGGEANITINTADWDGAYSVSVTHGVPDMINVTVRTSQSLAGDVLIATIKFTVMHQEESPPYPSDWTDESPLDLQEIELWNHVGPIDQDPAVSGRVIVPALLTIPLPWLEVDPANTTLGPELVIGQQFGKEFYVNITMNELHKAWNTIGVQFRLSYDPTLLKVVSIEEGPYMASFPSKDEEPLTWFYGKVQEETPVFPEHVLVGILIYPLDNGTWIDVAGGEWVPPEAAPAEASGTLATIGFKALKQSWTTTYTDTLDLFEVVITDTAAGSVDYLEPVDGSVTILPIEERGRHIDVWVENPDIGGQGLGEPADLVLPQTELTLKAKVTYNWQPVVYKKVTFEIRGPGDKLWAVLQDDTDEDGHATVVFRMPWAGQGAEENLGKWNVTVSVTHADEVITDFMPFDYDYLIRIWSVTTDQDEYYKSNDVVITVEYGTKSRRMHDVTLFATIQDELGVPIGLASVSTSVGGGAFCTYKNDSATVTIHIPTWAYAGMATVRASFVSGLPTEGGEAVAQEATATIWILPLRVDDPWLADP